MFLRGELDISTEEQARRILLSEARSRTSMTLDMSEITFCDSTGLKLVTEVLHALPKGGRLQIVGANRRLRKLFDVSGLSRHPAVLVRTATPG